MTYAAIGFSLILLIFVVISTIYVWLSLIQLKKANIHFGITLPKSIDIILRINLVICLFTSLSIILLLFSLLSR